MPLGELIGSVSERGAPATPGHLPLRRPCLTTHSGRIIHRDGRALLTRRQQPQTPREGPHRRLQGARGVHLPPPWSRPCRGPECGDSGEVAPQTSTLGQERRSFEGGQGSLHTCLEELPENRGPATPGRGPEGSVGASLNTKAKRPVRDADDLRTSFFSEPRRPRPALSVHTGTCTAHRGPDDRSGSGARAGSYASQLHKPPRHSCVSGLAYLDLEEGLEPRCPAWLSSDADILEGRVPGQEGTQEPGRGGHRCGSPALSRPGPDQEQHKHVWTGQVSHTGDRKGPRAPGLLGGCCHASRQWPRDVG